MAPQNSKEKSKFVICQNCIERFEPTEIYTVFKVDHYYFSCKPCMEKKGVTGEVWRKPRTRKTKS
jgi:hypothetical protein